MSNLSIPSKVGQTVVINGVAYPNFNDGEGPPPITPPTDIEIIMSRSILQAGPENILFKVEPGTETGIAPPTGSEVIDNRYHDLDFEWDFGDAVGPQTFTAPTNLIAEYNDTNFAIGPMVTHCFMPGTYTVTVTVTNPVTTVQGTADVTFTVLDPAVVFPGAQTFFIDNATASNPVMPAGAVHYFDLPTAWSAYIAGSANVRLVFARGQTHSFANIAGESSSSTKSWRMEAASGAGAKPILDKTADGNFYSQNNTDVEKVRQIQIIGLDIRNAWDASGTGTSTRDPGSDFSDIFIQLTANFHKYISYYDTDFSGWFNTAVYTGAVPASSDPEDPEWGFAFSAINCSSTNWRDYGLFFGAAGSIKAGGGWAVAGCRVTQNPDAVGTSKPDLGNRHGCFRINEGWDSTAHQSDWFNCAGWSTAGIYHVPQPTGRFNTRGTQMGSAFVHMNVSETSGRHFVTTTSSTSEVLPMNAVMRCNIMLSGWSSNGAFSSTYSGWTAESNQYIRSDVVSLVGSQSYKGMFAAGVEITPPAEINNGYSGRMYYRNNTAVVLSDDTGVADQVTVVTDPLYSNVEDTDNLLHIPNITVPNVAFAPMTPSVLLNASAQPLVPRYTGHAVPEDPLNKIPGTAHPADSFRLWVPAAGSPALGAASGDPYRNVLGAVRLGAPNVGAF